VKHEKDGSRIAGIDEFGARGVEKENRREDQG
jgi:hypothetical protein